MGNEASNINNSCDAPPSDGNDPRQDGIDTSTAGKSPFNSNSSTDSSNSPNKNNATLCIKDDSTPSEDDESTKDYGDNSTAGESSSASEGATHPPASYVLGRLNYGKGKPRILLSNFYNPLQLDIFSTDQTAKGRPEWIFPHVEGRSDVEPPDNYILVSLSVVISDHDERGVVPSNLSMVPCPLVHGAPPQWMVARLLKDGNVPVKAQDLNRWKLLPEERKQKAVDDKLHTLLAKEARDIATMMESVGFEWE